jgi:hypothetical protein
MPSHGAQGHGEDSKKAALELSFGHGWKPTRMKSIEKSLVKGTSMLMDEIGHSHGGLHSTMPCLACFALLSISLTPREQQGR